MGYKNVICIYPYKQELKTVGFLPPIGLEYVASAIEDIVESVKIIDLRYEKKPLSDSIDKNTDLVLVSYNWDADANDNAKVTHCDNGKVTHPPMMDRRS